MALWMVTSTDGRAETEEADTAEQAVKQFKRCVMALDESPEDTAAFLASTVEVKPFGWGSDDPICVCGTYLSEHALCGCGDWERAS